MGKSKLKSTKGITLVALVVTIIILLILAGVTINYLVGHEGLIKRASLATNKYQNARDKEEETMNLFEQKLAFGSTDEGEGKEKITAEMVAFTPTDSNWKATDGTDITNVKQALDYLYNN